LALNNDSSSDDRISATQVIPPKPVADHRNVHVRADSIFVSRVETTDAWFDSE
jgi:hypothetical protein